MMGGDPSKHKPGHVVVDRKGRMWTCRHTDGSTDPASTISLAGFCSYCGFLAHEPRGWARAGANRPERLRAALMERDGPWCAYCARRFGPELPATIDHVVPRCHAQGTSDVSNLVLACGPCNNRKADRLDVSPGAYVGLYAPKESVLAVAV